MKRFLLLTAALLLGGCLCVTKRKEPAGTAGTDLRERFAVTDSTGNWAVIGVKDLGTVYSGEMVEGVFVLENRTSGTLDISSAVSSCGCTIVDYEDGALEPDEGREVRVTYDSKGRRGVQYAEVVLGTTAGRYIVRIVADVKTENNF